MRRAFLALAAVLLALAGCGGSGGGGNGGLASATPAASPGKSPGQSGSSATPGKAKIQLLVRAVTPGQSPGKPKSTARVGASQAAQVLAYPTGATRGDVLEIRIPDLVSGRSHVTAEVLHGRQAGARAGAVLTTSSPSASITAVRYVCQVSNAPTYCPIQGRHSNGAYVLRTRRLQASGRLVIVVAIGSRG